MAHPFSRRRLFAGGGVAAALASTGLLTGCDSGGSSTGGASGGAPGHIKWWDQFLPKAELEKKTFATFHADGGPEVDYTVYNPNDMGQAVQLAHQSNQMPDVFTLAGLNSSAAILQAGSWFAPIANADTLKSRQPRAPWSKG